MELTIHIGPHKTGTTAIQVAFAGASGALRRQGLLYPRTNWLFSAQHRLAFALKGRTIPGLDRPDPATEIDELLRALDRFSGNRAFISSEEFFACPPDAIRHLHDRLGPARIVAFPRRPDDFLVSCYNQKIKQPGNGFSAPIRRFLDGPEQIAPEFDYLACISAWADVFGDAAIRLETYESGPPLARLRDILELGNVPADPPGRPNASVPGVVAEIMRHAKATGMAEAKQRILFTRIQRFFAGYPPFVVSAEDRERLLTATEPDMNALFARFGLPNPYRACRAAGTAPTRTHNLVHQDMLRFIETLL